MKMKSVVLIFCFILWRFKFYFILKYLQLHVFCLLKYKVKQQIVNRIKSKGLKSINHKHQLCAYMLLFRMLLMCLKAALININNFAFFLSANKCTSYCCSVSVNHCEKYWLLHIMGIVHPCCLDILAYSRIIEWEAWRLWSTLIQTSCSRR